MLKQYIQLSEPIPVEEVVNAMKRGDKHLSVKHLTGEIIDIPIYSTRMKTYIKGTICVCCNKEAHFFIVEKMRHDKSPKGHFNLYHRHEDGSLRMMTSDHIIPKSRGGSNDEVSNRQPMCCYCNFRKGNLLPGETRPEKKRKDDGASRTRTTLKFLFKLTESVKKGMPLERFWEVRAKCLTRLMRNEAHLTSEEQKAFRSASMIG